MIVGDPLLPLLKIAYQHLEEAIADTRDLADFPEQHAKVIFNFCRRNSSNTDTSL